MKLLIQWTLDATLIANIKQVSHEKPRLYMWIAT